MKGTNRNDYGHEADVYHDGKLIGTFVYRPEKPLSCGARVWFETTECEVRTRMTETELAATIEGLEEDALVTRWDEAMLGYISPDEIDEHDGDPYEAYCETCNGEAGDQVIAELTDEYDIPAELKLEFSEGLREKFEFLSN